MTEKKDIVQEIREIVQEKKDILQEPINHGRGSKGSEKSVMKGNKFSAEGEYLANDEEKREDRSTQSSKPDKEGAELLRPGVKIVGSGSNPVEALVSRGASTIAVTNPYPEFPDIITPVDLASINGYKGISGFLAELFLTSHLELLTMEESKDGRKETSVMEAVQTVLKHIATLVLYGDGQVIMEDLEVEMRKQEFSQRYAIEIESCKKSLVFQVFWF
ncbi:hypothetical protein LR48_Vigan06g127100 [Vigna angularis]|uniref:Uncharacterized protein n=1 Tax=Phaseolus angularis TaxID=3914 RepID=A0A0L9USZ6_PHAAN|nr:hypothetical protein LR48_Vigan06g127100 [Vigna angularis]